MVLICWLKNFNVESRSSLDYVVRTQTAYQALDYSVLSPEALYLL